MAAHRFVAVVGSRALSEAWASQVAVVVGFFLARGWGIGSGGARVGGRCSSCPARTPPRPGERWGRSSRAAGAWCPVPASGGRAARALAAAGVRVGGGRRVSLGCLTRVGVHGATSIRSGRPAAVVLAGGGAALPSF